MKTILADSDVFLWALADTSKLGARAREVLAKYPVALSALSIFELVQKQRLKRLNPSIDFFEEAKKLDFDIVNFDGSAVAVYRRQPQFSWNDPFDHMVMAQSIASGYKLLTADKAILSCGWQALDAMDARV